MKYRIKITTYKSGRKGYRAQVKALVGRLDLFMDGTTCLGTMEYRSRESALEGIDNHFGGNTKKQTIEFEYIEK